jgi:hypothetical protein
MDESPSGCAVSAAALPRQPGLPHGGEIFSDDGRTAHQRDWDFLCEKCEDFLSRRGIAASSSTLDKVKALAGFFARTSEYLPPEDRGKLKVKGFHPVDVLLHGQHCSGRSSALAGLCLSMGVAARPLHFSGHSVCEVEADGRWYLFDNNTGPAKAEDTFLGSSYMEGMADPYAMPVPARQSEKYHWMLTGSGSTEWTVKGMWINAVETSPFNYGAQRWWRFQSAGVGTTCRTLALDTGHGLTLPLDPSTAKALYPNAPRHVFKYNSGEPCRLTLCLPRSWMAAPFRVGARQGIRKTFHLGAFDDGENPVTRVTAVLRAAPNQSWRLWPPFNGWVLRVNGTEQAMGGGTANGDVPAHHGEYGFHVELPLTCLRENTLNTIEMENVSAEQDYLVTRIYPDMVEPYEPCFLGAAAPAIVEQDIMGVHTCDTKYPHIPV